jgi:hypothetical protein
MGCNRSRRALRQSTALQRSTVRLRAIPILAGKSAAPHLDPGELPVHPQAKNLGAENPSTEPPAHCFYPKSPRLDQPSSHFQSHPSFRSTSFPLSIIHYPSSFILIVSLFLKTPTKVQYYTERTSISRYSKSLHSGITHRSTRPEPVPKV